MLRRFPPALALALLLTPGLAQVQAPQTFRFTAMGSGTEASGQLTVRTGSSLISVLTLRGLMPNAAYVAHYHALGPAGGPPCASAGPVTLSFPKFRSDARGQATVTVRADPARMRGPLGAYVDVHRAADRTDIPLCAAVLNSAAAPVTDVTVNITDNRFQPAALSVKAGTTVTWVHTGKITHNVVSAQLADLSSPDLRAGQRYSYTFQSPGTYTYYCSYHDGMSATITVTNR
ncbi:cupredoxin domain-containing protein (plasmid) [Deinococcus taeanensis]|uniref:cupredoxin domain-containing protein n=1 Tax=Deinococcus taeanensis TaxID=2737050 RepID=UPI001CDCC8FD|nr:plastocyanin/azurin family copper-binding protein [Deinococcus taeanensis]UBV44387.1 cupredoxin domain-containing protein [Deinococcus taeanensis]